MSKNRPGYWKMKTGEEIRIQDMDEPHLKNSMRFLRKIIVDPSTSPGYRLFCEENLVELGNDAQRRGLVPAGDIPMHVLMETVTRWQTEWDARPPRPGYTPTTIRQGTAVNISRPMPSMSPFRRVTNVTLPALVSKNINVEIEIGRVTGYRVATAIPYTETLERRLDMDL